MTAPTPQAQNPEARTPQALAADPAINAFVMANAGAGKTTTLVSRVARLLLNGSRPEAILCLTFTKAAAAEMQRRLYERLGGWTTATDEDLRVQLAGLEGRDPAAYDADGLSRARRLFTQALETPGGLKIQTIHAFCEQLLRRFPIEAGVSPLFRVADDAEASAIRAAARARVAERSLGDEPGLAEAYAAMAGSLDFASFEAMFDRFEARRAAIADWIDRDGGVQTLLPRVLALAGIDALDDPDAVEAEAMSPPALDVDAWFAAAAALSRGGDTDKATGLAMQSVAERLGAGDTVVAAVKAIFFTERGDGPVRKKVGTQKIDPATLGWLEQERLRLAAAVGHARACKVARDTLHALVIAGAYDVEYRAAKARRGALDFADLIEAAVRLLKEVESGARWVLYKLDGGVDHILVDEAQDTSPEQWAIIDALTDEFFHGEGAWAPRERDQAERSVFVVGDEKQSIFSFQGAAPERLLAQSQAYDLKVTAAGRDFRAIELIESWRSTPEVLGFVDRVFLPPERTAALSPGRGRIGDGVDSTGIRHVAARTDGRPGTVDVWEPIQEQAGEDRRAWDEPMDVDRIGSARKQVAERIVNEVRALVSRGEGVHAGGDRGWRAADYGDVLILVRKRGPMFEEILRALKQGDVPVAGADRLKLSSHPVFLDLLALGRAALFPDDDLTLAAVLRSPLCDLSEDDLYRLCRVGIGKGDEDREERRRTPLWKALREAERAGGAAESEAAALIAGFGAAARDRTPFDLYAGLLNRRDGRGLTMRQRFMARLGGEAADAMDAFLDQALAAEGRGVLDLERFCHDLASLDQTVKREMDQPRGEVRVMTAHSSKGLEAPIVILPDTIFEEPKGDALLETADGGFLWCGSSKGDCDASASAREARKRRNEEESLRLLYVGLTRARDRLIVGGRYASNRKRDALKAWWRPLDEAVDALGAATLVEGPYGSFRRYGADPIPVLRARAVIAPQPTAPHWLEGAPAGESQTAALSPSRLDDASRAAAPSPLTRLSSGGVAGDLGRFRRGDLIHRLLERLPDLAPDERAAAAGRILAREPDLDDDQRAEMIQAAFGILNDLRFAPVFGPGSRAEVAVTGRVGDRPVSGRIDRLVVSAQRVLIVDYKTNRPAPDAIEGVDPAYLRQLALYATLLRQAYPDRAVEAALVWTDGPRLTAIPPPVLEAVAAS